MNRNSVQGNMSDYREQLIKALLTVDVEAVDKIADSILSTILSGKRIYLIGNGGSASIVEHAYCDLFKTVIEGGLNTTSQKVPLVSVLTGPSSITTAISNDVGFQEIFSWQIDALGSVGDCLIAVSSSGKSENIINAAKSANQKGMILITFTGFSSPPLKSYGDLSIHVDSDNYGIIEDVHASVFHSITQRLVLNRSIN
jgi:phosphoheptose isomerase